MQHENAQLTVLHVGLREQTLKIFSIKVYRHFFPVGSGHWPATHQSPNQDQDESSSCPPKHESSWKNDLRKDKKCTILLQSILEFTNLIGIMKDKERKNVKFV